MKKVNSNIGDNGNNHRKRKKNDDKNHRFDNNVNG